MAVLSEDMQAPTVREVVGVFDDVEGLRDAIGELQQVGFMRQDLGFLADERTVHEKLGQHYTYVTDMSHNADAPRALFMPNEPVGEAEAAVVGVPLYVAAVTATCVVVATGGTLLAAIAAAAGAGAGAAALGAILSKFIADHHADYIQTQLEHGGMLLWVHVKDPAHERKAREILDKHAAHHVQAHEVRVDIR